MARRRPGPGSPADWSAFVPRSQLSRVRRERLALRWRQRLSSRPVLVAALLLAYLAVCVGLMLWSSASIGVLALLPLLLAPPVGYLAYWLVWREFHE